MKASLLTAVLLLALAAAPTEAMERSNSLGNLPAAGGRPLPLQHQGTLARLHGNGNVKKMTAQHMEFINQAGQPNYQRLQPNSQQMKAVKNFLSRHKDGRQITNDEAEAFNVAVHRRVSEYEAQAREAAGSNPGQYNGILADLARQQSRLLVANIQNQNGALNDANLVEAQALAALLNQGKPDYSAHIQELMDALDAWEAAQQRKPSAGAQQPAASVQVNFDRQRVPEATQFERSFPEREIRWREAKERVRRVVKDPSEAAVMLIALGVEPKRAVSATVAVFKSGESTSHFSGSFSFDDDSSSDGSSRGSSRGSKKLEIVQGSATNIHGAASGSSHNAQKGSATVISLDPTNIQSSGQSSNSPRGSLIRQGSGSNLSQEKCYIENPGNLREAIVHDQVPLKSYGNFKFTTQEIAELQARSAMTNKASLAQGALYTYAFGVFSWRSSTLHNGMMARFWQWSSSVDSTVTSGGKSLLHSVGGVMRSAIPFRANRKKPVEADAATRVASILYYMCIPQACHQDAIYGFYNTLVRGLHGLEADRAMSLMKAQKKIDERNTKNQGRAGYEARDNVLVNHCPHQSIHDDF